MRPSLSMTKPQPSPSGKRASPQGAGAVGNPREKGTQDKMLAVTSIDRRRVTHMPLDPAALRVHRIEVSIFFNDRSPLPIQSVLHSSYALAQSQTDTSIPHGKTRRR